MIYFLRVFLFSLSLLTSFLYTQATASEISPKEALLIEKISTTIDALEKEKQIVWRDYNLSKAPLIITFSSGNIYAFGLQGTHPSWETKQLCGKNILFSETDFWDLSKVSMQNEFIVDGQPCFVFTIDENKEGLFEKPILVLIHELFHLYQFDHFKKELDSAHYVDELNTQNLALIQIEEHLLIEFLSAKTSNHQNLKKIKLEALKNYMAIHLTRKQLINPSSLKWERFQQVMEGLADYVSFKTVDAFSITDEFNMEKHLAAVLESYTLSWDPQELAVKWSHYGIGSALGVALDFLNVNNWKEEIELNGESQGALLEKALPLSEKEIASRVKAIKKKYHFKKIENRIKEKVENFSSMIEEYRNEYRDLKGLEVKIEKPYEVAITGGGKNLGIFHLKKGFSLFVQDSSFSSSSDNLWLIEFKDIPYAFQDGFSSRIFKIEEGLTIFVDGKRYSLEELKEIRSLFFNTISWDGESSHFESRGREGHLLFDEERGLSVIFRF